jgi:hypothetical protein
MTFGNTRGSATDDEGNLLDHVWVEVRRMVPDFPLATPIYADAAGDTALDNPFMSETGEFVVYAVGGSYRITVYRDSYSKTWDDVPIGSAAAADVDHYAQAGFTWAPESATTTPPSTGCVRFDTADLTLAGHAYVDATTLGNSDATEWLSDFAVNDWFMFSTGVGVEAAWRLSAVSHVTGTGVDYFDFTLTTSSFSGPASPYGIGDSGFINVSKQKAPAPYGAVTGPWVTAHAYGLYDQAEFDGSTYSAAVPHTSGVFADDLAAGKWTLVAAKGDVGATDQSVLDALGIHSITVSTSDPSGGQDGDLWFKVLS